MNRDLVAAPVRRSLIGILAIVLVAVLAADWVRAERQASQGAGATASFDWSEVSSRDLNIAAVFLTARDVGIGRAMDSLQIVAIGDSSFRNDGHMIAHALGRFAIANNGHDPSVLRQCRPTFQAGCYHGVLEGYLAALPAVDPAATTRLCTSLQESNSGRFAATECSHGLGHGFAEALKYDLSSALGACDSFSDAELRRECHDGVFMENAVHGLGAKGMNVGDSAMARMPMMNHPAAPGMAFHPEDLRFPCDSVGAAYQQSCWSYQPIVIASLTGYDFGKTLDACADAPAAALENCYQGFGKQSLAWFGWSDAKVISACDRARQYASSCLGGGVEGLVDLTLDGARATAFCRQASVALRPGCLRAVNSRVAHIHLATAQ